MTHINITTKSHSCTFEAELTWYPLDQRHPEKAGRPQDQPLTMSFADETGSTLFVFPPIGYRPPLWERIKAVFR